MTDAERTEIVREALVKQGFDPEDAQRAMIKPEGYWFIYLDDERIGVYDFLRGHLWLKQERQTVIHEDKQAICNALAETLKLTQDGENIIKLKYDPITECVVVCFKDADPIATNVADDSGIQLIWDIIKRVWG